MKHTALFMLAALLVMSGCAPIPPPLDIPDLDDRYTMLTEPLVWRIGKTRQQIVVPAGFVSDYASIPPGISAFIGRRGRHSRAAIVHDYLYWSQKCTRTQADRLMLIGMREMDVAAFQRWIIYTGVDWGGSFAWNKNRRLNDEGEIRIIPAARRSGFGFQAWPTYRETLERAGVKDATFADSGAYCSLGN